jgi:hypothetical protein
VRIAVSLGLVCGLSAPALADDDSPIETPPPVNAQAQGRVIYLNHNAQIVYPAAQSDSTNDPAMSNLIGQPVTAPGWVVSPEVWSATMTCVEQTWARFDVSITDQDPGPGIPHVEVLVGGSPLDVGVDKSYSGIAPMRDDCGIVDNPVVFVFPTALENDPILTCGVISQETAHTFGLDHEMLAGDPMSYLPFVGQRVFQDQMVPCGEFEARQCGPTRQCGEQQDSVELLAQRVGFANGETLGSIAITKPADKAVVPATFDIAATASPTTTPVTGGHLYVDGEEIDYEPGAGPFAFTTPSLPNGQHEIDVVADAGDNHFETSEIVDVDASANDADALGCSAGGGTPGAATVLLGAALAARQRRRLTQARSPKPSARATASRRGRSRRRSRSAAAHRSPPPSSCSR